ncbi:MAG TPA: NUDIX hydrolase [Acidimicrobiia bacterium]|nr:NUDIX hydrolase [Acidimicrobiia bacterium]
MTERLVEAAGGVVVRAAGPDAFEVLVVHRPRYDDWSLPKGKLDPSESFEAAALREVEEETGIRAQLGPELATIRYTDRRGRPKVVRYWQMTVVAAGPFEPNEEVDEIRWVPAGDAAGLLTYDADRQLVAAIGASR